LKLGTLLSVFRIQFSIVGLIKIVDGKLWLSFEYKSCSLFNLDVCRTFDCFHCYCGIKVIKMRSNSAAALVGVDCVCRLSGGSVGSLYFLIVSCVWLFWCWELLMVRWCSFGPCLTLCLDNWRRQVNVVSWSTRFHLLFELPSLNFRIHMSQDNLINKVYFTYLGLYFIIYCGIIFILKIEVYEVHVL
jgi:hypothetical protein